MTKEARPKIKIQLSSTDKLLEALGWLTLVILWAITLYNYSSLPDIIPTHYNGSGQADGYGSKQNIFDLPIIGLVLFIVMTVLNKYPHIFNYPIDITAENALTQYTNGTRIIRYLKFAIALIFLLIVYFTHTTALGKTNGLGLWFLPLILGLLYVPLIFSLIKSSKVS